MLPEVLEPLPDGVTLCHSLRDLLFDVRIPVELASQILSFHLWFDLCAVFKADVARDFWARVQNLALLFVEA